MIGKVPLFLYMQNY